MGGVKIDQSRAFTGYVGFTLINSTTPDGSRSGAFKVHKNIGANLTSAVPSSPYWWYAQDEVNSGWVMPVGAANAPRHFGVLACAYLGQPAA